MLQIADLQPGELEWLAQHLGHTVEIHRSAYRLHESTIELAKVSKLLIAIDSGNISTFKGKSLTDINIDGEFKTYSLLFCRLGPI